jgi:hypothetical protein
MSYARLDEMMSHVHDVTTQESHDIPCRITRSNVFADQQHRAVVGTGMLNARYAIYNSRSLASSSHSFSARWGSVMVSKYTRRLIDEVGKEAEVSAI